MSSYIASIECTLCCCFLYKSWGHWVFVISCVESCTFSWLLVFTCLRQVVKLLFHVWDKSSLPLETRQDSICQLMFCLGLSFLLCDLWFRFYLKTGLVWASWGRQVMAGILWPSRATHSSSLAHSGGLGEQRGSEEKRQSLACWHRRGSQTS